MTSPPPTGVPLLAIALRLLPTAVRCRRLDGAPITYRKTMHHVVPGQLLTIAASRSWTFRRTEMAGGTLLASEFSVGALQQVGYDVPSCSETGELRCPGERDERLRDALLEWRGEDWLAARCLLLEVLEDKPGSLIAHSALGCIHAELRQRESSLAFYTAAITLGLHGRVGKPDGKDAPSEASRALSRALVGRALERLAQRERKAALADLRLASRLDQEDESGASQELSKLLSSSPPAEIN